ncbi:MAG: phosphoribosylglycinamide formyltransferase [Proteiniphilum sp.]|nr:phosphoribosylglycinamide formyltransferase [Proteiniphilum sp.]MDD4799953.1 phosphoribosylglycinamide formyltransferase [Proteiniphilum sp.]
MIRLALFASGSGSNAENIADYFQNREDVEVSLILSNKRDAYVHVRARRLGIPSCTFSKSEFDEGTAVLELLRRHDIGFIVLAGFLLKVSHPLLEAYPRRIVNIHPALLPKHGGKGMYGDRVHRAVVEAGETESGITIHYVNEHYDEGDIIFQATCEVLPGDTPEELAGRVHALEYTHFPRVIEALLKKIAPRGQQFEF